MEKIVAGIKKVVRFKGTTREGDIVLIAAREPRSLVYALVTDIVRDESRKDEWWQVTFRLLTFPPQKVTWILRTEQFTGREIFTLDNKERFVQAVDFSKGGDRQKGKIIRLLKKDKKP